MKHNHDFNHVKTCKIRGRNFKVVWRGNRVYFGQCDAPDEKHKVINVCKTRPAFEVLMTVIHEFTHGAFFDLDESAVEEFEAALRRFLTRMRLQVSFTPRNAPSKKTRRR